LRTEIKDFPVSKTVLFVGEVTMNALTSRVGH